MSAMTATSSSRRRSALAVAATATLATAAAMMLPGAAATASAFLPPHAPRQHAPLPTGFSSNPFPPSPRLATVQPHVASSTPPPSKIIDEDGPTPEKPPYEFPEADASKIKAQMSYDHTNHPIPHQPWRRGDVDGCDDPVDAPWRLEAEHIIETAAASVGAYVVDVTWYLTFVCVTLDIDLGHVDTTVLYTDQTPDEWNNLVPLAEDGNGGTPKTRGPNNLPDINVVTSNPRANIWLEGPGQHDSNDPAGFPVGSFAGEEHARVGPEWDDDDDDDDDDEDYEPEYDEDGKELPKPAKPTRSEAVYAYNEEKREKLKQDTFNGSRRRIMTIPSIVEKHQLTEAYQARFDFFDREVNHFEQLLVQKYGWELPGFRERVKYEFTEEDLTNILKLGNEDWGLSESQLLDYREYIRDKYSVVENQQGEGEELGQRRDDVVNAIVRADGITDDYADRLSVVAGAIKGALAERDVDERLDILDRHEVVLTSTNFVPSIVETQREFDAKRGEDVCVHTQDPWNSNRVLRGKLVDRNVLDVILNMAGRMVTVPNNMVAYVCTPDRRGIDDGEGIDKVREYIDGIKGVDAAAEEEDEEDDDEEYEYEEEEEEEWDEDEDEYEYEEEDEEEEEEYDEDEVEEEWEEEDVEEEDVDGEEEEE